MTKAQEFLARLAAAFPAETWQDVSVMVAVSGGADSVALLRGCAAIKAPGHGKLLAAHFHHGLRGQEADQDAEFVEGLCRDLSIDFVLGRAEPGGFTENKDGLEAAARDARYAFLQQAAQARGTRYLLTAHTADDQAETVLHHVLRGTGLGGLAGIPRTRVLSPAVTLVRPMLDISRQEVLDYLTEIDQPYRSDATNDQREFTRNRLRHDLLPLLARDYSAAVRASLVRLSRVAGDAQRVIQLAAAKLLEPALVESSADQLTIDPRALANCERHLVREIFVLIWDRQGWPQQAMTFSHWDSLAEMAMAVAAGTAPPKRKHVFPGEITVERVGDRLQLRAADHQGAAAES